MGTLRSVSNGEDGGGREGGLAGTVRAAVKGSLESFGRRDSSQSESQRVREEKAVWPWRKTGLPCIAFFLDSFRFPDTKAASPDLDSRENLPLFPYCHRPLAIIELPFSCSGVRLYDHRTGRRQSSWAGGQG